MPPKKDQCASKDADSVFRKFPHIEFRPSKDPKVMTLKFDSMIRAFLTEIRNQSAKENGQVEYLLKEPLMPNGEWQDKYYVTQFPANQPLQSLQQTSVLPNSGFVVVVMRPASQWSYLQGENGQFLLDHNGQPQVKKPIKFLFKLSNLYLQGYLIANRWILFNDVNLKDIIPGVDISLFTTKLRYDSSYGRDGMDIDWRTVQVGYTPMQHLYKVLLDSGRRYSQGEKQQALATIAVTCSESTRRKCVYNWMRALFSGDLSQSVDKPLPGTEEMPAASSEFTVTHCSRSPNAAEKVKAVPARPGSGKFTSWSSDCKYLRKGITVQPGMSYKERATLVAEYRRAVQDVVVVLPRPCP